MTSEAKVKQSVKKLLARYSVWYCMPVGGMLGKAGVPDFLLVCNGRFIAVETKAGRGRLTALQRLALQQIEEAGGVSLVINESNLYELEKVLDATSRKRPCGVPGEECRSSACNHAEAKNGNVQTGGAQ